VNKLKKEFMCEKTVTDNQKSYSDDWSFANSLQLGYLAYSFGNSLNIISLMIYILHITCDKENLYKLQNFSKLIGCYEEFKKFYDQ
jgi:hypothetical protein